MNKTIRFFSGLALALVSLQVCIMTLPAQAQDFLFYQQKKKGPTAEEIYVQLPADEQERLIEEATQVHEYCNGRSLFSSFHDCQCVSAEFWNERVLNYNPNLDPIAVADQVANQCPNEPGVAGFAFNRCTGYYRTMMKFGLDEFCTCYANTFAELYMLDPRAYIPNVTSIGSLSTRICSQKGMPSPLAGSPNPAR